MRIPQMRHHTTHGLAYARHRGRCVYFGPWGSPRAESKYRAWVTALLHQDDRPAPPPSVATVAEACAAYEAHASSRYVHPDGEETGHMDWVRRALAVMVGLPPSCSAMLQAPGSQSGTCTTTSCRSCSASSVAGLLGDAGASLTLALSGIKDDISSRTLARYDPRTPGGSRL